MYAYMLLLLLLLLLPPPLPPLLLLLVLLPVHRVLSIDATRFTAGAAAAAAAAACLSPGRRAGRLHSGRRVRRASSPGWRCAAGRCAAAAREEVGSGRGGGDDRMKWL